MALLGNLLFSQDFSVQTNILIVHNLNRENVGIQLIISGETRANLVETINPTSGNEKNSFTVNLTSVQTGTIQVFEFQLVLASLPSITDSGRLITGSGNSIDDAVPIFVGTDGYNIEPSPVTIDLSGNMSVPGVLSTSVGGDLNGTLPNPTVVDLTITGEVQGSVLYFDGTNWVHLPPGTANEFLQTQGGGSDPNWAAATTVTGSPPVNVTKNAAVIGIATDAARADHKHDIDTAAASTIANANAEGSSSSLSRSDHIHALGGTVGGDLNGTLPNPTVTDLTITGEVQGSVLYFDGTNWVHLPPAASGDGFVLQSGGSGADPTWVQRVYGTEINGSLNLTFASTTGAAFLSYTTFTTPVVPAGVYKFSWSYTWSYNSTTSDFNGQMLIDGGVSMTHIQEPKDAAGGGPGGTNQRYLASGFTFVVFGAAAAHTVDLQYASGGGATASMYQATLEFIRVV